ncbi:MAG: TetR/AcrR family transcriptional regulator [Clostridia bacterium]|nr:TetR/AcrR family transcriptional regulator [Clostridia bacterium]
MANKIEGVKDKLLVCAATEFLQKGYKDAPLREIAKNADTSTSSIFVRFGDKAGLFQAIVHPVAENFAQYLMDEFKKFTAQNEKLPVEEMFRYTEEKTHLIVDASYDNFDAFRLVICCADGTEFEDFIGKLADIEAEQTLKYIVSIDNDAVSSGRLSMVLLHMLSSAYWSGVFEAVRHNMTRKDAKKRIFRIQRFFRCGWLDIFNFQEQCN